MLLLKSHAKWCNDLTNYELELGGKETGLAKLVYYPRMTEENYRKPHLVQVVSHPDLNQAPPKHKFGVAVT
jgi:hypothetical protein